jgi:hypothetical protein
MLQPNFPSVLQVRKIRRMTPMATHHLSLMLLTACQGDCISQHSAKTAWNGFTLQEFLQAPPCRLLGEGTVLPDLVHVVVDAAPPAKVLAHKIFLASL